VVTEAINYVKQLEERVKELEEDIKKKDAGSVRTITRSHAIGEMNTEECYGRNESVLEVEARVLGKKVLIKIHCGMQEGIVVYNVPASTSSSLHKNYQCLSIWKYS